MVANREGLKLVFLSYNSFSGGFPVSLSSLSKLYRIDLSYNNFSGSIPLSVNNLTQLLTLRLEENGLLGSIPDLRLPNLQDFNVSGNRLTGEIPVSLSNFPATSFWNNPVLCGAPLKKCKAVSGDPKRSPKPTVASSPTAMPTQANPPITCYSNELESGKSSISSVEKIVYSSSPYPNPAHSGFERGKIVFFEGERRFELEDLLRASAEMLGKGGLGTAYKAILDDGNVVAVKRLKDLSVNGKKEFEQQMEVLGKLKHPNLLELKAYFFARDEKLLVYDYMPNGNLFWLLHGKFNLINSLTVLADFGMMMIGPGRTPLHWTTRLKIAAGAARALAFIHSSCKSLKLMHGNIKSTNILIDKDDNARVSDFGLSVFAPAPTKSNGYRAPEAASSDGRKLTQKSDVYSFGVLLLELLTGKCPSMTDSNEADCVDLPRWVQSVVRDEWTAEVFDLELMRYKDIEEEMVGLLQIGMACAQASPDQRPHLNQVVKMIDELRGVEVSPSHRNLDSVSDSPAVSEEAAGNASD
ncbi:hypothetical protein ACS0TY_008366 [Phlomoides rotata]